MRTGDDEDAPDGVDLDGDVDMERDGEDEEEEYEEEEDEEEEDEVEEHEEENDGKEHWTISQGEMVNSSADNVYTMLDQYPILLPEQGQEMNEHTPRPEPPAPANRQQTLERCVRPQTPETHPQRGLDDLGLVTAQKPRQMVPCLREAEAARNTSDVDVDQQLLCESAGDDSLPDVHLPDVPLTSAPLPVARPNGSVGEEWTSLRVAEVAMVVGFWFGSSSRLVRFLCLIHLSQPLIISHIVRFLDRPGFILFIVLWDITHAGFLCSSWHVRNLLVMVLRLNKSVKLAESIVSLHTRLLRPSTNFRPFLHWILNSSCVVDNAIEDPSPLHWIFVPNEAHLRQLAT